MSTTSLSSHRATPVFKRPLIAALMTALLTSITVTGCSAPESNDSEPAVSNTENKNAD